MAKVKPDGHIWALAGATVPLLRYAPLTWQSGSQAQFPLWTIFVN